MKILEIIFCILDGKKMIFFFIFTGKIKSFKQTRVSCTISKKIKEVAQCLVNVSPNKPQRTKKLDEWKVTMKLKEI